MTKKEGTKTSSFGVSARINHDSTKFYNSNLYKDYKENKPDESEKENVIDAKSLDKIFCKSSENMSEIPDNSVHLMITSPPYNVGKEYDKDLSLEEYLKLIQNVMKEVYRVLTPGGRVCINIANIGRKPYIPLHAHITQIMLGLGFLMRGEVIWNKSSSAGASTAWGSWKSANNPILRDTHEYILIFSKNTFSRKKGCKKDTIAKEEFLEYTKSIWSFPAASAKKIGHPAPFSEELPRRLIQLYSFEGDVILDPFIGSGQTAIAALKSGRFYIGYDTSNEYCELTKKRVKEITSQKTLV